MYNEEHEATGRKMFKSSHIGTCDDISYMRALVKVAHPGPPYHESIPNRMYMPDPGRPVLWQASDLYPGHVYTQQQYANVLDQPHFRNWWVMGNEQDLPFGSTPAATPTEFRDAVIQNMREALSVIPGTINGVDEVVSTFKRRFFLSGGSRHGPDSDWTRQMLLAFQENSYTQSYLAYFDSLAVNYYNTPTISAPDLLTWLRGVHDILTLVGLNNWTVFLKEVGVPISSPYGSTERSAAQGEAVDFIEDYFTRVTSQKQQGRLGWLEGTGWFAATDMGALGMYYAPLYRDSGIYTRAGTHWLNYPVRVG
ncbi:MAG: hypothetical protein HY741_01875 [Chloroflexi bacterium]|nr:hypothetical protein [Chloroflexota bacterium]